MGRENKKIMKTIFKRLSVLTIAFLFFNCSSDSGDIPSGDTPCVPITCLNGGTSSPECGCNCPQGYTGSNCSTQITPTKITITKIRITKFPNLQSDGSYWDSFSGIPDIYVKFLKGSNPLFTSEYYTDAISTGTGFYDFKPTTPIEIVDVNTPYILSLFDYDSYPLIDDNMGITAFYLYSSKIGFPTTISLGTSTDAIRYELTLSYSW